MKEKFEKLKELWAIPRYKAIIKLILFIIFFALIYLIMFIATFFGEKIDTTEEVKKTALENYVSMNSYEYTYEINYILNKQNITKKIIGTKYNDKNDFKILNDKYYIKDNMIYNSSDEVVNNINEYDLLELDPIKIVTKLGETTDKKVTKYNDGKIKTEYNSNLYNIITYEDDNYISEIELDLTNIVKEKNNKITYYSIKIIYTNINNITSYD